MANKAAAPVIHSNVPGVGWRRGKPIENRQGIKKGYMRFNRQEVPWPHSRRVCIRISRAGYDQPAFLTDGPTTRNLTPREGSEDQEALGTADLPPHQAKSRLVGDPGLETGATIFGDL